MNFSKAIKDVKFQPDGIILTLPVMFFEDRGMSTGLFKRVFERQMRDEDNVWNFRLTNLPINDVLYVYLVFAKHIQYRANLVQYERGVDKSLGDSIDGTMRHFKNSNWVVFTGPIVKPPHEWPMKGFQGFRYTAKLF